MYRATPRAPSPPAAAFATADPCSRGPARNSDATTPAEGDGRGARRILGGGGDPPRSRSVEQITSAGTLRCNSPACSARAASAPSVTSAPARSETLVVWRLDRLGRILHHLVDVIAQLEQRDIAFLSLREAIGTTTAAGGRQLHLFAALAEFERELIRERSQSGREIAKAAARCSTPAALDAGARAHGRPLSMVPVTGQDASRCGNVPSLAVARGPAAGRPCARRTGRRRFAAVRGRPGLRRALPCAPVAPPRNARGRRP